MIKTHRSEGYGFANNFIYSLCILQGLLKQYEKWGNLLNESSNDFGISMLLLRFSVCCFIKYNYQLHQKLFNFDLILISPRLRFGHVYLLTYLFMDWSSLIYLFSSLNIGMWQMCVLLLLLLLLFQPLDLFLIVLTFKNRWKHTKILQIIHSFVNSVGLIRQLQYLLQAKHIVN